MPPPTPPYSPTYIPLSTFPQYIPSLISPLHIPSSTPTPYNHLHFCFHISSLILPSTFPLQHYHTTLPLQHYHTTLPHFHSPSTFPHTTLPHQHFPHSIPSSILSLLPCKHYATKKNPLHSLFNIPPRHSLITLQHPFTVSPS